MDDDMTPEKGIAYNAARAIAQMARIAVALT